jgi:uncharacterized membrane protein
MAFPLMTASNSEQQRNQQQQQRQQTTMKILSWLLYALAILVGVAAIIGGIYVCVYQGWFLGIVGAIEAGKATPIESAKLAWSIIRVFLGSAMGTLSCWLGWLVAAFIFAIAGAADKRANTIARAEKDRRARLEAARRFDSAVNFPKPR